MAVPSEDTLTALTLLSADPRNLVYIISGRDVHFLSSTWVIFGSLACPPSTAGSYARLVRSSWTNFTESMDMSWMNEVLEVFKYYTERTTGSHIESQEEFDYVALPFN